MSEPCARCGATQLVTVRFPGHDDIEAVLCLTCTAVQHPHHEPANKPGLPPQPR